MFHIPLICTVLAKKPSPTPKEGELTPRTLKFTLAHLVPLNNTEQDKSYFHKKCLLIS